jgi:hypothetical protein
VVILSRAKSSLRGNKKQWKTDKAMSTILLLKTNSHIRIIMVAIGINYIEDIMPEGRINIFA